MGNAGRDIGYGIVVKVSTVTTATSSTAASAVGSLIDIGGFSNPIPSVDVTNIADAAACMEPGIPAAGAGSMTIAYKQNDTGANKLLAMNVNRTKGIVWVVFPSSDLADESFKGFIADAGIETMAADSHLRRTFSIQPSSAIGYYAT